MTDKPERRNLSDTDLTQAVVDSFATSGAPRFREIAESLVRHLHAFATDVQLTVARTVRLEPIRSLAATGANLTRDIGATQLSAARWFLDA